MNQWRIPQIHGKTQVKKERNDSQKRMRNSIGRSNFIFEEFSSKQVNWHFSPPEGDLLVKRIRSSRLDYANSFVRYFSNKTQLYKNSTQFNKTKELQSVRTSYDESWAQTQLLFRDIQIDQCLCWLILIQNLWGNLLKPILELPKFDVLHQAI